MPQQCSRVLCEQLLLHKNRKGLYEAKPQVLVQIKAQARYGKTAWKVG